MPDRARFVMIHHSELDKLMGDARALEVWCSLIRYADFESQRAFPSLATLARTIDASEDTVRRAIGRLERLGMLHVEKRKKPGGDNASNVYHLKRIDSTQGGSTDATPPVATEQGGGSTDATPGSQRCKAGVASVLPKQEPDNKNQITRPREREKGGGGGIDLLLTRKERADAEKRLRAIGLAEWEKALIDVETNGITFCDLMSACDQYEAHRAKFDGPGALLYRIEKGTWPVDGVSDDVSRIGSNGQQKDEKKWEDACHRAFKEIREATRKGSYVDESQVVALAVQNGVPEWFARKERGLDTPTSASAEDAA